MKCRELVVVTSSSFSQNPTLRQELEKHFENVSYNTTGAKLSQSELINVLSDAYAAIVGLENINEQVLNRAKNLKLVAKYGVGLDNIDFVACEAAKVRVGWTPGVNAFSVAEHALGLMLSLCRNLYSGGFALKSNNTWVKNGGIQLGGKTVGVIGVGNIGKEIIKLLQPFSCTILGNDIEDRSEFFSRYGVRSASKDEIFSHCDIVTLHVPLNDTTQNLVNSTLLSRMKQTAFLINTSRGGVVAQADLKVALSQKKIAGAALDVYDVEPPTDREFLELPNLVCTPHTAGNSVEAVLAMGRSAISHLTKEFCE